MEGFLRIPLLLEIITGSGIADELARAPIGGRKYDTLVKSYD